MKYDFVIIGGGIVGVSTAWQLKSQWPNKKILLLEKEAKLGQHQTGHNSGVIHSGAYYLPGSLKAQFCKQGAEATIEFCKKNEIPFNQCGKLLVATNNDEYHRVMALSDRCQKNGVDIELLDSNQLVNREPNVTGIAAIYVPAASIVNYQHLCEAMARLFVENGGELLVGHKAEQMLETGDCIHITVKGKSETQNISTRFLIACGGLCADRLARQLNIPINFRIVPFRGEYYRLASSQENIVKHLIYPISNPELPFLGVHLTPMIDGSITVGPNAVLGFKREGYAHLNFSLFDSWETLSYPGFWKLAKDHWRSAIDEFKNAWSKEHYLQQVKKYCPGLTLTDLLDYPAGIRAQAVMEDGSLANDFLFAESPKSLHVCNAPSPAATSAIPIGRHICELVEKRISAPSG